VGRAASVCPDEPHSVLIDKRTLRPIPMMSPAAEDGLVLTAQETEVQKSNKILYLTAVYIKGV
jgi:hypothetical protein